MPRPRPFVGVYFIHCPANGLVKIGFTANDPDRRLTILRAMSPEPLEPLGVIPGPMSLEGVLHRRFAKWRRHGEWFEPDGLLETFINYGIDPWPAPGVNRDEPRPCPGPIVDLRAWAENEARRQDDANAGWRCGLIPRYSPSHLKPKKAPE